MNKSAKIILITVIVILLAIIGVGAFLVANNLKKSNQRIKELENQVVNLSNNESNNKNEKNNVINNVNTTNTAISDSKKNNIVENTTENTTKKDTPVVDNITSLNGTYEVKTEGENYYYSETVVITNQTNKSIDFDIQAVHGRDVNHVNMGAVKGTATKIRENLYEFAETIDNLTYHISFTFDGNLLEIGESYPDNINPYAGNNVYFKGKLTKK